jgi:hypothetical protein
MSDINLPPLFGALNTASALAEAAPDKVWAVLFQRGTWLKEFAGKQVIDGTPDGVGERALFATHLPDGGTAQRIEEILFLDQPRRLVTRLALKANDATFAFAEWRLMPIEKGTMIEMNLYWTDLPEGEMNWPEITVLRQSYIDHTQNVMSQHLLAIAKAATS